MSRSSGGIGFVDSMPGAAIIQSLALYAAASLLARASAPISVTRMVPTVFACLPACRRGRAQFAHVVLQPTFRGIEGIADRDINVLVRLVLAGVAIDHQRRARHVHDDADVVELAATAALMRRLHRRPATDDAVESVFELPRPLSNSPGDEFRWLHAVEVDLDRNLHCAFSLSPPGAGPPTLARFTRVSRLAQRIVYQRSRRACHAIDNGRGALRSIPRRQSCRTAWWRMPG